MYTIMLMLSLYFTWRHDIITSQLLYPIKLLSSQSDSVLSSGAPLFRRLRRMYLRWAEEPLTRSVLWWVQLDERSSSGRLRRPPSKLTRGADKVNNLFSRRSVSSQLILTGLPFLSRRQRREKGRGTEAASWSAAFNPAITFVLMCTRW